MSAITDAGPTTPATTENPAALNPARVNKRCVFYLSGFDPRGGRHYHALYQSEAQLRPAESTSTIEVSRRIVDHGDLAWDVQSVADDHTVHTQFKFMAWDRVIRQHWPKSRIKHWLAYLRETPTFLFSGFFQKSWLLGPEPAGLLFFPNVLIIGTLIAMVLSTALTFGLIDLLNEKWWLAAPVSLLPAWAIWTWAHWFETSRDIGWTMRSYAFTARQSKGETPEMEARLTEFALKLIDRAQHQNDDEILVIGHSSGAVMAASMLARAIQLCPDLLQHNPGIGLLTLGQCLPMLGLLPGANTFREELKTLAQTKGLLWVDISAPSDRCCVAMIDPIVSCGVEVPDDKPGAQFLAVNPLFHQLFAEHSYEALKKNAFQLHFQYLKAPPSLGDYDYFEISAGALSLRDRFTPRILAPLPKDFDASSYLRLNPDLAEAGIEAVWHYQRHGAAEQRRYQIELPDDFDPVTYLELNPDVAGAGIDGALHYVLHGQAEGRVFRR